MRAERPDSQRVVAQMLGYHMGCALPSGKDVSDQVRAHATRHDGG